jgi:hypothetical protein
MKQDAGAWGNCVGGYLRLPTFGKDSYFWDGLLVALAPVLLAVLLGVVIGQYETTAADGGDAVDDGIRTAAPVR